MNISRVRPQKAPEVCPPPHTHTRSCCRDGVSSQHEQRAGTENKHTTTALMRRKPGRLTSVRSRCPLTGCCPPPAGAWSARCVQRTSESSARTGKGQVKNRRHGNDAVDGGLRRPLPRCGAGGERCTLSSCPILAPLTERLQARDGTTPISHSP